MADEAEHPVILAGDRDRDASVELLSGAVGEGRLTLEEFSERVGLAQRARTRNELAVLTCDLPAVRPEAPVAATPARYRAVFSKLVRRGPWELEQRSSLRCIFGTAVLDLTQVRLSGSETQLDVYNLFGTVTLIVPDEVQVSVTGGGAFASEVTETRDPPAPGAPRLRIAARGPGGTLYVRAPAQRRPSGDTHMLPGADDLPGAV